MTADVVAPKLEVYHRYVNDVNRGQVFAVAAFRNPGDVTQSNLHPNNTQTRRYVLNPNHSAHRDRKQKEKFALRIARLQNDVDSTCEAFVDDCSFGVAAPSHVKDFQLQKRVDDLIVWKSAPIHPRYTAAYGEAEVRAASEASSFDTICELADRKQLPNVAKEHKRRFSASDFIDEVRTNQNELKGDRPLREALPPNKDSLEDVVTVSDLQDSASKSTDLQDYFQSAISVMDNQQQRQQPSQLHSTNFGKSRVHTEGVVDVSKLAEKQEMMALNPRLAHYIRFVRDAKENAGYVDSKVFMESVKVLEEELDKLKSMYSQELDRTRSV